MLIFSHKKLVVIGLALNNDTSYLFDWLKMYDEIYIGYYNKEEKLSFSNADDILADIEVAKVKIFYFDIKELYKKHKKEK